MNLDQKIMHVERTISQLTELLAHYYEERNTALHKSDALAFVTAHPEVINHLVPHRRSADAVQP